MHCIELLTRDTPNVYLPACAHTTSTIIIIILNKKIKKTTTTNGHRCGGYHCLFNCSASFGLCLRLVVAGSVSLLVLCPRFRCLPIVFPRRAPSLVFRLRFFIFVVQTRPSAFRSSRTTMNSFATHFGWVSSDSDFFYRPKQSPLQYTKTRVCVYTPSPTRSYTPHLPTHLQRPVKTLLQSVSSIF